MAVGVALPPFECKNFLLNKNGLCLDNTLGLLLDIIMLTLLEKKNFSSKKTQLS